MKSDDKEMKKTMGRGEARAVRLGLVKRLKRGQPQRRRGKEEKACVLPEVEREWKRVR